MSLNSKGTGGDYLVEKSDLAKSRKAVPPLHDILIIEDENMDGDRLTGTLRAMFGYDLEVRRAKTLAIALDQIIKKQPELILLDDVLKPLDTADSSLPMIRRAGYTGPIVVISGQIDRFRHAALVQKGADESINKDELDSGSIAKVLLRLANDNKFQTADVKR